ncbi:nucleotidyltransferase domain-containing protein [Pannonibacter indicus]|uniref:nucleotidyltransferase domain-containing protein n=1 Tax=Pannonibacter indicus TaxID=466044 RepID=UPI0035B494E2
MHIYAFGSVCRGDIGPDSDIDLLAIVDGFDDRFDPDDYSIYSRQRIQEIWVEGNPFAWHLFLESRMLHSSDGTNILVELGRPTRYDACARDCEKFQALFLEARSSIANGRATRVFDLSMIFLAIRNFATCFSLGFLDKPDFSRRAAIRIGASSLAIPEDAYKILERSRILCTRGKGAGVTDAEVELAIRHFTTIEKWMVHLLSKVRAPGYGA